MADPVATPDEAADVQPIQAEDLLGLNPDLIRDVIVALDAEDGAMIRGIVAPLHPAEVADLIEMLRGPMRNQLVEYLRLKFDPVILAELDEKLRDEVAELLGTQSIARAIAALDSDDALNIISALEEVKQRKVLQAVPAALRGMIEEGLAFPEDSAGRLMQREFVAVPAFWTVGEVIDFSARKRRSARRFLRHLRGGPAAPPDRGGGAQQDTSYKTTRPGARYHGNGHRHGTAQYGSGRGRLRVCATGSSVGARNRRLRTPDRRDHDR